MLCCFTLLTSGTFVLAVTSFIYYFTLSLVLWGGWRMEDGGWGRSAAESDGNGVGEEVGMLGWWQLQTCMVQGDKGVSRRECLKWGYKLTTFLSLLPFLTLASVFTFSPASDFHLLLGVFRDVRAWNLGSFFGLHL
ncbi:hypothetical protein DEO72_LG9g2587 [Vigna unguiculata]|uniref:Uncharacterized protein n=1 Tax=Vigna unguiculata TaxID=3917 RepID=A0A4D6N6G5_VIGUN|nr:hypothetical protein DEO72_LG9g2587 [Vigna unguiculata]